MPLLPVVAAVASVPLLPEVAFDAVLASVVEAALTWVMEGPNTPMTTKRTTNWRSMLSFVLLFTEATAYEFSVSLEVCQHFLLVSRTMDEGQQASLVVHTAKC